MSLPFFRTMPFSSLRPPALRSPSGARIPGCAVRGGCSSTIGRRPAPSCYSLGLDCELEQAFRLLAMRGRRTHPSYGSAITD